MSTTSQRVYEGVFLLTTHKSSTQIELSVKNDLLKVLNFTADLSGSENVKIEESESLVHTAKIPPKKTGKLLTLHLSPGHKLTTKFKFAMNPPDREEAMEFIGKDIRRLERRIAKAKEYFRHVDFNTMELSQIPQEVGHFVDPYFTPTDTSAFLGAENKLNTILHWRRPKHFFEGEFDVFLEQIEPNDIKQGMLGDCWFMCAIASLAERPRLVERLFITKQANEEGFYQIKFCKGGEWVRLTVDDYFPCFPKEGPIYSRSHGNELWVLLLEKAYAKLHGSYTLLRGGWAHEGMMDLTGCPTLNYDFSSEEVKNLVQEGKFWKMLKDFDDRGALISASTEGEDRWTEVGGPKQKGGLVPGHAYTVIKAKSANGNRLVNIRNPWGSFEWNGDWSDNSPLWTPEMVQAIRPVLDDNDGTFWMSFEDFLKYFSGVNICIVDSFYEGRVKGEFNRVKDEGGQTVVSKWYYEIESKADTKVYIGVHQEDERIYGVSEKRPYVDLSIAVLENDSGDLKLFKAKESVLERQAQLEIDIEAGKKYIILPRTGGCTISRPKNASSENIKWLEEGEIHPLVESTIKDIFRKANKFLGEDLSYTEFNSLMKQADVNIPEEQFQGILDSLPSHDQGLTQEGLIEFMRIMLERYGEEAVKKWFKAWGYDQDLHSTQSRTFVLTLHSKEEVQVIMRKAEPSFNRAVDGMLLACYADRKGSSSGVQLYCLMQKAANGFMYGAYNGNNYQVEVTFDCSGGEGLIYASSKEVTKVVVPPNDWRVLNYCQIAKNATSCRVRPNMSVRRA